MNEENEETPPASGITSFSSYPLPPWMPPRATCHPGCALLDVAVGLRDLGYSAVPINVEKTPMVRWGEFDAERPGWGVLLNEWRGVWREAAGVAVVCSGPLGLVVLDFDDEQSWTWALANLHSVRGVKTRRGGHLHFAHPPNIVIKSQSGERAVTLAEGVRADVKGGPSLATAPYSRHPSGYVYQPLGDWTRPVAELPMLPTSIAEMAEKRPLAPAPAPVSVGWRESDPVRAIDCYLRKVGGVPDEKRGSDNAVFSAAVWAKANVPDLTEEEFISAIRRCRSEFGEAWIASKWRSAKGQ